MNRKLVLAALCAKKDGYELMFVKLEFKDGLVAYKANSLDEIIAAGAWSYNPQVFNNKPEKGISKEEAFIKYDVVNNETIRRVEAFLRDILGGGKQLPAPYDDITTREYYQSKGRDLLAEMILEIIAEEREPDVSENYLGEILKDRSKGENQ